MCTKSKCQFLFSFYYVLQLQNIQFGGIESWKIRGLQKFTNFIKVQCKIYLQPSSAGLCNFMLHSENCGITAIIADAIMKLCFLSRQSVLSVYENRYKAMITFRKV